MPTIVKIINEMLEGDIDSYNLFKNKVMGYIDSHYPNISDNEYEDIFENIIEDMIANNVKSKSNNMYQYTYRLINSNIKKYNNALETESDKITKLNEEIYYSEDLIFNQIYKTELMAQIYNLLNTLTERERKVIKYRFYEPSTLAEIGKRFGLSRDRIRQIEDKALWKLRNSARRKKLVGFLDNDYKQ